MATSSMVQEHPLRLAHLTTVDMSLALLLGTELEVDVEQGHTVFGVSAPGPYVDRVEALGVTHVPVRSFTRSWSLLSDLKAFVELFRTLRSLKLDVLHTHTPKAGVMGRIAGRLAGVPVVVNTCHGLWARPDDRLLKRVLVYGAEALAMRFSDYELFQNAEDAHTMRRFLKKGRWKVVGNGIDLERFQPDPEGRARVRAEWGVADDEILVGTIGRRVREKGLAEFAEAADALSDKATFVWVGPEDDTDSAATVPHQHAIRFLGERTDMSAVYSALDIFVLASYREGFSRASMEAAAHGKSMVLSDIRGCREIGTDGEHLLLSRAKDGAALAQQISRLLDDGDLRERLGASAEARARSTFDQRQVARESLTSYDTVLRAKAAIRQVGETEVDGRAVVLHVLPQDLNRGAQVYAGQLRDELRDDPRQNHLIVCLFEGSDSAARPDIKLAVPSGALRKAVDPRALARLRQAVAEQNAAVVVAHGGEALKYVIPAAGKAATVYYKLGLSSAEIARPWHRQLYRTLSNRATRVVGVSQAIVDQVGDLFGVPRERLALIPNGRDTHIYRTLDDGEYPVEPPRALWVGRLEPGKRPGMFLDVVDVLRRRGVEFSAAMVGDGPLRSGISPRASELDVELMGVRGDVPQLLRKSAALVMTSAPETEGMPGVLIEAGLCGVPVVSTPAAGVSDIVQPGETGFVVASTDEIAARLNDILTQPALRMATGTAARGRCATQFSVTSTARQWSKLTDFLTQPHSLDQPTQRVVMQ